MDASAAFVEVVAVVVGILVALGVNDWNQRRLDRRKSRAYVASLKSDVAADVDTLDRQAKYADGTADAAQSLLQMIRGETPLPDANTLLRLLKRAGTIYPFRPTKTTFQELSGGGNLSVIEDRELLRAVIAYYAATQFPEEAATLALRRIWFEYYDALSRTLDPTLIPSMTLDVFALLREGGPFSPAEAAPERALPSLGLSERRLEPQALRSADELERALSMVLDSAVLVRESLRDLHGHAVQLVRRLEAR
jgi:hypothetical protein